MDFVHNPPNDRIIDEVWIGLSEDPDGKNGIVAAMVPGIGGAPMVTSSPQVLAFFKGQIDALASIARKPIKIYRFTRAEVVFEAEP